MNQALAMRTENAGDAADRVGIGRGTGCTLREIRKRLNGFFAKHKMPNENWRQVRDRSVRMTPNIPGANSLPEFSEQWNRHMALRAARVREMTK